MFSDIDLIFLDEMSYNLNIIPNKGWIKKGEVKSINQSKKSINYSILSAMSCEKFLGSQIFQGGVKKQDYVGFVYNLIEEIGIENFKPKIALFHDGSGPHRSEYVRAHLEDNFLLLLNAPYSPQTNPIELCFSKLKQEMKNQEPKTEAELVLATKTAINKISAKNIRGYIRRLLHYIELALDFKNFD